MPKFVLRVLLTSFASFAFASIASSADDSNRHSGLPGHIDEPAGSLNSIEMPLEDGPECRKYRLSVPENRAAESSRNIRLYFYRFKARKPTDRPPVFFLPGGPGGFYNDDWVNGLNNEPNRGSNLEAWRYAETRDVVLVNQRGASQPDRSFQLLFFVMFGVSSNRPYDRETTAPSLEENARIAIDHWTSQGMDLRGYDIMNMVEDINDIRLKLGYEKIALRGTSFGSQWSMSYMKKYPQHVDRAVLGGVEPIDHGWDSPQGFWNVMQRLEKHLEKSMDRDRLGFPKVPLTEAIQSIVKRLEKAPVVVEIDSQEIPVGVQDFQRCLLGGIGAHRERRESFQNLPKFVYEVYQENYDFLAARAKKQRTSGGPVPLQFLLVDNSLGISKSREQMLEREPGRRWVGEPNAMYKATRTVTPTPVVDDEFRNLRAETPMLFVHGDFDLSTPIENAEEQLALSPNARLIRITGGTHGAFDQIAGHDKDFLGVVTRFLEADLDRPEQIHALDFPHKLDLPPLEFQGMSTPALSKTLSP